MGTIDAPSKEDVRAWFAERRERRLPLPDPQQLRHELGWKYLRDSAAPLANRASLLTDRAVNS